MHLDNCPFCGKDAVWEPEVFYDKDSSVRCGCQTPRCRGNIVNSPYYDDFKVMWKLWNMREGK